MNGNAFYKISTRGFLGLTQGRCLDGVTLGEPRVRDPQEGDRVGKLGELDEPKQAATNSTAFKC